MAIIAPVVKNIGQQDGSVFEALWTPLTTANASGTPVSAIEHADRSAQASGIFGVGGTVTIEGSNDGVNFVPLTDPQGNPIAITVAKVEQISEITQFIRPVLTGGDGTTSITVACVLRRNQQLRS